MQREEFEANTKPLYDGLREFSENADVSWLARDFENEFWIWNSGRMATVRQIGSELIGFSSHGPSIPLEDGEAAFEFVIGVFSASEDKET